MEGFARRERLGFKRPGWELERKPWIYGPRISNPNLPGCDGKKKRLFTGGQKLLIRAMLHTNQATQKGLVGEFLTQNKKDIPLPNQNETLWGVGGGGGDVFFPKKNSTAKSPNLPKFILKRTRLSCRIPPPRESLHVGHPFGSPVWEVSMWGRKRRGWHGWWLKSGDHQLRLVVFIPLFTGFYTSKRWLFGMSEPSTVWLMH